MADQERLEKIVLEYRKVSGRSPHWHRALTIVNSTTTELNFKDSEEDSFGYISAIWKLPSIDFPYEIRLKSICKESPGAPPALNRFISDSVIGLVDRAPPVVMGVPQPSVNLFPGDELAVHFTEEIECELPYLFKITIEVSELGVVFTKDLSDRDDLYVVCSDNVISIQFNEERVPTRSYSRLLGRTYTLKISDVVDPAGNVAEPYSYQSNFVCSPPNPGLMITAVGENVLYLPHQAILLSAVISNGDDEKVIASPEGEEWSRTFLELGLDPKSNSDDLTVHVNGGRSGLFQFECLHRCIKQHC